MVLVRLFTWAGIFGMKGSNPEKRKLQYELCTVHAAVCANAQMRILQTKDKEWAIQQHDSVLICFSFDHDS